MNNFTQPMGQPLDRVDGQLKVTGQARYAGEFPEDGLLHGSVVSSTIASGRVVRIDASKALALPGVIAVIDHTQPPEDRQLRRSPTRTPTRPKARRSAPCTTTGSCTAANRWRWWSPITLNWRGMPVHWWRSNTKPKSIRPIC